MKVLHISTSIVSQSAAWRTHEALLKGGVDSYVYVLDPSYGNQRIIYGRSDTFVGKVGRKLRMLWHRAFAKKLKNIFGCPFNVPVSLGLGSMINREFIEKMNPDVINLHWICGEFISTEDLIWLSRFPLVWTLHDSWAFTGGCHVPQNCRKWEVGCETCELMGSRWGIDLARYIFARKKKYYALTDVKIVGVSSWIADCARRSLLFHDKEVFCVHNTLNQELFKPKDKAMVRDVLGLPQDKKLILFGAMNSTSDENKGFKFLHEAISYLVQEDLADNFELMVFGSDEPVNPPDFCAPVHYMGRFSDNLSLSMLYSAADVMIVPSRSECFPNTVLESINCGTPVAAFRIGGIPDQIDHRVNGYLAKPYDSRDLAQGIAYILEDNERWESMSRAARSKAVECFNEKRISAEMVKVYEKAMADKKGR